MRRISTIGLDIAKSVFQVHGVGVEGITVMRRRLTRTRLLEFSRRSTLAALGSKPAPHHTTGSENFGHSGMMCD